MEVDKNLEIHDKEDKEDRLQQLKDEIVKIKENRLQQLKDEIGKVEFSIEVLKNSSSNAEQRKKFRFISSKDRKISILLKDLKGKAKDHNSMLYNDIKSIVKEWKSLSNDIKSILELWYFNNDCVVNELGINQYPTTIQEALTILPKLGINWPPKMTYEKANVVSSPLIPFDGLSSKWSSERKSRLDFLSDSESKFLSLFQKNISSQRNQLFTIGSLLNSIAYKLDPYNPKLSQSNIQFYKSQKKILFHNNKVLEYVCTILQKIYKGSVSEGIGTTNTKSASTTSKPYHEPGPSGTNNTRPSIPTSQPYGGPGLSGTNCTRPSTSTSQPYGGPGPSGINHTRPSMTTNQPTRLGTRTLRN